LPLYKSYFLNFRKFNLKKKYIYENMGHDISRLNYYHPIHTYVEHIPLLNNINKIYNQLRIIDYNDYIYSISSNTQLLHSIIAHNPILHYKTSSIVLGNIIYKNIINWRLRWTINEEITSRFYFFICIYSIIRWFIYLWKL